MERYSVIAINKKFNTLILEPTAESIDTYKIHGSYKDRATAKEIAAQLRKTIRETHDVSVTDNEYEAYSLMAVSKSKKDTHYITTKGKRAVNQYKIRRDIKEMNELYSNVIKEYNTDNCSIHIIKYTSNISHKVILMTKIKTN